MLDYARRFVVGILKVIVWVSLEEEYQRLKKDLSSNQNIMVMDNENEARAAIVPHNLQILVVGNREEDASFVLLMKEINPALRAVQFGLSYLLGPPKPPFDMLMTKAHPECSYEKAFKDMINDFVALNWGR